MVWASLLVIVVSIVNRALAVGLYMVSFAFVFWVILTVVLVVMAYLDYRKIKAWPKGMQINLSFFFLAFAFWALVLFAAHVSDFYFAHSCFFEFFRFDFCQFILWIQ